MVALKGVRAMTANRIRCWALVLGIGFWSAEAHAALVLFIDDPLTAGLDVLLEDTGGSGFLSFSGSIGDFVVNTTGVLSKPIIGSAEQPRLDTLSLSVSRGAGVLEIGVSDTGFTGVGPAVAAIGGSTSGRIVYQSFWDPANDPLGRERTLGAPLAFEAVGGEGPEPFAMSTTEPRVGTPSGYALTQFFRIVHDAAGDITSFDARIDVTPQPLPAPASPVLFTLGFALWTWSSLQGRRLPGPSVRRRKG